MQHLEPNKKDRSKFDIDLAYGKFHENEIANMFENTKFEIKSERDIWVNSGNIAIEYESYGKPSGIAATESDYWLHKLCVGDKTFARLIFDVDTLRQIVHRLDKRDIRGGDHNASRMYLLSLEKLFRKDVFKLYKEEIANG